MTTKAKTERMQDTGRIFSPLVRNLKRFDAAREAFLRRPGEISTRSALEDRLSDPVSFAGETFHLTEPTRLKEAVAQIANGGFHLEIRADLRGMPRYYLCRLRSFASGSGSFISDDLYRSPDFPLPDPRLCKLFLDGREWSFVRMSDCGIRWMEPDTALLSTVLPQAASDVFRYAWDEDQMLAALTARHFSVEALLEAVECVYLALCVDPCRLRGSLSESVLIFVEHAAARPAMAAMLRNLADSDGDGLNRLVRTARDGYERLSVAFQRFLGTEIVWMGKPTPLSVPLFSNFTRLSDVARPMESLPEFQAAREKLATSAREVLEAMRASLR